MDNVDRNKLLLEYQKLLKRLDSAERWAIDNKFNWDDVKKYNALVHLVAHPRKSMNEEIEKDDVAGSANITNLADYVTTISRAKDEEVEYDAVLKVLKNRHTGVNVGKKLMFDIDRKRFYSAETGKELNRRYFDNLEQINITEWENI